MIEKQRVWGVTPLEKRRRRRLTVAFDNLPLTGFTFIETLFVVIVLGVLMAVAVPRFQGNLQRFEFDSFSRQLQMTLDYLSQRSVMERSVIVFTLDRSRNVYWAGLVNSSVVFKNTSIPKGIRVDCDRDQIYFYPDASIDQVNLSVSSAQGQSLNLTTQGVYGHVKVQAP